MLNSLAGPEPGPYRAVVSSRTLKGIRKVFIQVFLNLKMRQVIASLATLHPNETWVVAQAESFVKQSRGNGLPITYVQHDRHRKFTKSFDAKLKSLRVKMKPNAFRAPNINAFVERFIQSIWPECLDRFAIFGEQQMDHVCQQYLAYYHEERPHQSLENEPIATPKKRDRQYL